MISDLSQRDFGRLKGDGLSPGEGRACNSWHWAKADQPVWVYIATHITY